MKAKSEAAAKEKSEQEAVAKKAKSEALAKQKADEMAAKQKAGEAAAAKKAEILAKRKKAKEDAIAKMKAEKLKAEQEAAAKKAKEEEAQKAKPDADKKKEENVADAPGKSDQTVTESKQEELMKKRMLLKKKKAALAEAQKKMEASKAKVGKESADAGGATLATKSPLPPVPEEKQSASKPTAFGASTTSAKSLAFGVPKATPLQSEPDGPKPSFFGSSASAKPTFGGISTSSASKPFFGGAATPATPSIFGGGVKPSSEPKPAGAAGGGSFLNLTPPGKAGATPGKFVFGKSANITLAVPTGASPAAAAKPNPFASAFGQAAKSPFGAPFGTSPFGGGDAAKKRSLDSASDQPDAKKPNTENDDAAKRSSTTDRKSVV